MPTNYETLTTALTGCSLGLTTVACSGDAPIPAARNPTAKVKTRGIRLTWDPVRLPATELEPREPGDGFQKTSAFTTETHEYMNSTPGTKGCTCRTLSFADAQPLLGRYSTEFSPAAAKVAN